MFHWFADRRSLRLTREPFPAAWDAIIRRNVAHYGRLDEWWRARLRALIQVL